MNDIKKQLGEISCVFEGFDGKGAIYISGIKPAKSFETLKSTFIYNKENNIKAVLCAARSGYIQYS
jgi:hypothetical protein